jgi:hypothetical protein
MGGLQNEERRLHGRRRVKARRGAVAGYPRSGVSAGMADRTGSGFGASHFAVIAA